MGIEDSVRQRHSAILTGRSTRRRTGVTVLNLIGTAAILPVLGCVAWEMVKPRTYLPAGVSLIDDLSLTTWSPASELGWQVRYAASDSVAEKLARLLTVSHYKLEIGQDISGLSGLVAGQFGIILDAYKGRYRLKISRGSDPAVYRNLLANSGNEPKQHLIEPGRLDAKGGLIEGHLIAIDQFGVGQLFVSRYSNQPSSHAENLPGKVAPVLTPAGR